MLIKIQRDATVCRYLFTAKSLYMFRVSQHPSSGVLKTVTAASGTGHNTVTATSLHRGLISPYQAKLNEAASIYTGPCIVESNLTIVFQQDATYSVYYISVGSSTCFVC